MKNLPLLIVLTITVATRAVAQEQLVATVSNDVSVAPSHTLRMGIRFRRTVLVIFPRSARGFPSER